MPSAEEIAANLRDLADQTAKQSLTDSASGAGPITRSPQQRWGLSTLGKGLDILQSGLNLVTLGLRPVVTGLNPDLENVYKRYEHDTNALGISRVTPSALVEEAIPGKYWYKGPIKFVSDVALDPLSYVTFGGETAAGEALSKARSLVGETIKLDTPLAQKLADIYGESRPLPNTIRMAKSSVAPVGLKAGAEAGERALVQFHLGIPGTKYTLPPVKLVTGAPVLGAIDKATQFVREAKYGKVFRTLFSTQTTNPDFNMMEKSFVNLLQYRKGEVVGTAKAIDDTADMLALKLNIPRDQLDRTLTDLVERPSLSRQIVKKVVTRVAPEAEGVKNQLVQALRGIGESKAADFWDKKPIWDPQFKSVLEDFKTPNSPIAHFMQRGGVLAEVSDYLAPLKRLVKDTDYWNGSKVAKSDFVDSMGRPPGKSMDQIEVNPQSKYLRQAYKDLPQGTYGQIYKRADELITQDLLSNKVSLDDVNKDLYRDIPQKLQTTKPRITQDIVQNIGNTEQAVRKASAKLERLGAQSTYPEDLLTYYSSHFFRPTRQYSPIEDIANKSGSTATRTFQLIRKGQLADILKENRGDVYDKINYLVNEGIIDNRGLMPSTGMLNQKVMYNDQDVLVRGTHFDPKKGMTVAHDTIPREQFEREISETKKLLYQTKQIMPLVHGTNPNLLNSIMEEGLRPAVSMGANTKPRDIAAGVFPKVFATTPLSDYGELQILLPTSFLEKASALPGDGLYLPANPMITKYLLTKGQDGIVDMTLRRLALWNNEEFQGLRQDLLDFPNLRDHFAKRLVSGIGINTPDIHLTGPIPPENFVKTYALGAGNNIQKQIVKLQDLTQEQISNIQLIQKGERYFTRFFDMKGNPLADWELRGAPNLAKILSKLNVAGTPIDAEKQAAVIEKLIGKSGVPEGESMFTYLRKTQPQLFAPKIEPVDNPTYIKQLENYGLLSDQSIDSIATNILNIRDGVYGRGLSSQQVLESPVGATVSKRILINQEQFTKAINDIPGINAMPTEERMKLVRNYWAQVKSHERGHDLFNLGLRSLPDEVVSQFTDEAARLSKMDLRGVSEGTKFLKAYQLSSILKTYTTKGEDAAVKKLLGPTGWDKMVKSGSAADYEFMKSVVHKMAAHVDELFSDAHSMYQLNPKGLQRRWPEAYGIMKSIYQRQGWKTDWVTSSTQIPRKMAVKYPEIFDLSQKVRAVQNRFNEMEVNLGNDAAKSTASYPVIRPVITREAKEIIQNRFFKGAKVWNDKFETDTMKRFRNILPSQIDQGVKDGWLRANDAIKLRKEDGLQYMDGLRKDGKYSDEQLDSLYRYLLHDEVNALARAGKLKALGGARVNQFFETDPATQIKVRGIEGARARTSQEYFQAAKQFGIFRKALEPGNKFVKQDALAGWQFPAEIADHIDRYHETVSLPHGMSPILDLFDNTQNLWKAWTLTIFPAYHTKFIIGHFWNNFLAGVVDPRNYRDAHNIVEGKLASITTGYGKIYNTQEMVDLAKQHDVWKIGQHTRDVEELFEKELKKGSILQKARDNSLLTAGREILNTNYTKFYMAHFINKLEAGYSPAAAAQSVKKYLFDYGDLTSFEKNVMKRVFPFYSWTRKNIPLQLEGLMTQPGKALGVIKAKNAIESNADGQPDERYLPDWMTQNFPIRTRRDPKSGNFEYFLLGSWLPLTEIDKIFQPEKMVTNMFTPLLKEPLQQMLNKDFFTGKEIDRGGEYQRLAGVNMPKRLAHVLENIRLVKEADKLSKKDVSIQARVMGAVTGKVYPLDIPKEKRYMKEKWSNEQRNIDMQLKTARKAKDPEEVQRVLKMSQKLKEREAAFKRGEGGG